MIDRLSRPIFLVALIAAGLWYAPAPKAAQEEPEVLLPEQSRAKAMQVMQAAVNAMGGAAFMNVQDVTCTGNLAQFDHSGQLSGFEKFIQYGKPPLKDRTENLPQRNEIDVFNGDAGWNLDRGGVSEESVVQLAQFQDDVKKDLDNILRHRVNESDMDITYDGKDVVDLKQVDWVKLIDSDNRTIRISFDRNTHLPVRKIVETRNQKFNNVMTETEYYSEFYDVGGIQTPKQITRERNNLKVYQAFFDKCEYNTGLDDSLFTKQSLDERWSKMPNKGKYHDKNKKDNS